MRELHPDVNAALGMTRELRHRIATVREQYEAIVARRPSPSGLVIPEVDVHGRLRDLFLAPGTCDRFDNQELAAEIVAAIAESTADARRQFHLTMNDTSEIPRSLADIVQEWRANPGSPVPTFGEPEK